MGCSRQPRNGNYRGEETPFHAGSEARHTWLVDPNDATSAYLKGYRGSAVSIALLRDGVPVLGVVNAYAAPDNDGDLFAWAEGCGPLTRNGLPVAARSWPDTLTADSVAIVSHAAEKATLENLTAMTPARYRTETSIAYRLALLAAGEDDVCICLSSAGDWDYAGGHALRAGEQRHSGRSRRQPCDVLSRRPEPYPILLRRRARPGADAGRAELGGRRSGSETIQARAL